MNGGIEFWGPRAARNGERGVFKAGRAVDTKAPDAELGRLRKTRVTLSEDEISARPQMTSGGWSSNLGWGPNPNSDIETVLRYGMQCIHMSGYFSRVLRIFQRRLHNMTEFSEDQIRIILGCLFAALTEATAEVVDELKALKAEG